MKRVIWKSRIGTTSYMVSQIDTDTVVVEVHIDGRWNVVDNDATIAYILGRALIGKSWTAPGCVGDNR